MMLYGGAGGGMDAEADMARKRRCARRPACCPARPFAAPANAFKLHTIRFPPPRTDRKPAPEPARRLQACKRPSTPAFTAKTKSKFQARKRLCRTVSGALLLSTQERKSGAAGWRGACSDGRVFAAHCSVRLPCRRMPRCAVCRLVQSMGWPAPAVHQTALPFARCAHFSGANFRPRKRLCRTVFRAWLLSEW